MSPSAIFPVTAQAMKANVIVARAPPCSFSVFLVAWGLSALASLCLAQRSDFLTLYFCAAWRGNLKYTISRREWFSKIKNRQGAEKAGGVKCSLYPTISLMWWPCFYLVPLHAVHCPQLKMPEMLTQYTWIEICIPFLLPPCPTHGVLIVAYFNLILLHP